MSNETAAMVNLLAGVREARIVMDVNVLMILDQDPTNAEVLALANHFCGKVVTLTDMSSTTSPETAFSGKHVYLCGDIAQALAIQEQLSAAQVHVIRELSTNNAFWPTVGVGRVPILFHGVGVYYRRFFDEEPDKKCSYFSRIQNEHVFQEPDGVDKARHSAPHRHILDTSDAAQQGRQLPPPPLQQQLCGPNRGLWAN